MKSTRIFKNIPFYYHVMGRKKPTILKTWINELKRTLPGNINMEVTYIDRKLR